MILLLAVVGFSVGATSYTALISAFMLGLLMSLWEGTPFGAYSALYLLLSYLVIVYKRKVHTLSFRFLFGFCSMLTIVYESIVHRGRLSLTDVLVELCAVLLILILVYSVLALWNRFAQKKERQY
jgi:hypothetical protein